MVRIGAFDEEARLGVGLRALAQNRIDAETDGEAERNRRRAASAAI